MSVGASSTLPAIGIVGGIGPEATVSYYRALLAGYARRVPDGSTPTITIQSIDLQRGLTFLDAGDLEGLTGYLEDAVAALARSGAGFALLSANSPHIFFDELARRVSIPLLSIVEATCGVVRAAGCGRLALLGTRRTMEGSFYPEVFGRADLELAVPEPDERQWLHEKYLGELVPGNFLPETRAAVLELIDRLHARAQVDGVLLAGTELPLLVRQEAHHGVPLFDTARIHVERALDVLLEGQSPSAAGTQ
ncbi:MAG TPA: amino acid racemase [Thermoanaerobaculia bacterium]|nr:amino acid racemase [Thermoanaerobaculia bacterium]